MTAVSDLEDLVRPRSIAVVGASERPDAWGNWLFRKLLDAGFPGPALSDQSACPDDPRSTCLCAGERRARPGGSGHHRHSSAPALRDHPRLCHERCEGRSHYHRGVQRGAPGGQSPGAGDGGVCAGPMACAWWVPQMFRAFINLHYNLWSALQSAPICTKHRSPLSARERMPSPTWRRVK